MDVLRNGFMLEENVKLNVVIQMNQNSHMAISLFVFVIISFLEMKKVFVQNAKKVV